MHPLDITIIGLYFLGVILLALLLRKRATADIDSYFLGSRNMSWWMLGASGMASNVDMAGTMLIASLIYLCGFQGFFIELRGGVVLIMAFYLAALGKWTRRSGCMTTAEWMVFRFGAGWQGQLPRLLAAIGNIVFFTYVMAYFAIGSAKFLAVFVPLPPDTTFIGIDPHLAMSAGLIFIVLIFTSIAGIHGVVWTDILQGFLILIMAAWFSVQAFLTVDHQTIAATVGADWLSLLPQWRFDAPPNYEEFELMGVAIIFYMIKTALDGMSGAGGYIAQRYFAARDEAECRRVSIFWIVLMSIRWPMVMGIAILGLSVRDQFDDPEMVLPVVMQQLVPLGLRGIMLVALLAAAMSTYSSIMNAGASYFVKDIYQAFIRRDAGNRELVGVSIAATIGFVVVGLLMALGLPQVNEVWEFLNLGIGVALFIPNFLRWYWWRLNGYGYAAGVLIGMIAALALEVYREPIVAYVGFGQINFVIISALSIVTMVVVSLLTAAPDRSTVRAFFITTRPFGWWGSIRRSLPDLQQSAIARENRRDIAAMFVAVPWQLTLFLLPMTIVVHKWNDALWLAVALLVLSILLRFIWAAEDRDRAKHKTTFATLD